AAAGDDPRAVDRLEAQIAQRRLVHEAAQLARRILEREVQMAGVPDAAIGEFTLHPYLADPVVEHVADADREVGNGVDAARRRVRCRWCRLLVRRLLKR